jgi:adenylate kinase family enzyme
MEHESVMPKRWRIASHDPARVAALQNAAGIPSVVAQLLIGRGICDVDGSELYQRDDDKPDTVRARLKTFHKQTEPLIEYYKHAGLLMEVNGERDFPEIFQGASGGSA